MSVPEMKDSLLLAMDYIKLMLNLYIVESIRTTMEIRIDTQRDSKEEIRKVIELLTHFAGERPPEQSVAPSATITPQSVPPVQLIQSMQTLPIHAPALQTITPSSMQTNQGSSMPTSVPIFQDVQDEQEPIDFQVQPGFFNIFDETVTNQPTSASIAQSITQSMPQSPTQPAPTPTAMVTPIAATTPIDQVTKTANHRSTMSELFKDPLKIVFGKNDPELEEVQRLKAKSATKSEDLRVVTYK